MAASLKLALCSSDNPAQFSNVGVSTHRKKSPISQPQPSLKNSSNNLLLLHIRTIYNTKRETKFQAL